MRRVLSCLSTLTFLAILSCRSSELTRGEAKRIIQKELDRNPVKDITFRGETLLTSAADEKKLTKDQLDRRREASEKLFAWKTAKVCLPDQGDIRLAMGKYVLCSLPQNPSVDWQHPGMLVPLNAPIRRVVVEVTGITDASQSQRIVEDKWEYDFSSVPADMRELMNRLAACPRVGKAMLRLYDDGWRFEGFQ